MPLRKKYQVLILIIFTLMTSATFAREGLSFRNLNYDSSLSIESRILGRSCFSLQSSLLGLNCNSAFLAGEEKSQLRLNVVADESIGTVLDYRDMINDDDAVTLISELNRRSEPLYSMFSTSVWYQKDWWALAYTPLRAGVASHVRNPSLSELTVHVFSESELSLRAGFFFSEDPRFRLGGNIRLVKSEYLRGQFLIIDALANPDTVQFKENNKLYFDPALSYSWDSEWKPTISAVLSNFSVYQDGNQDEDDKMSVELGYATTPNILDRKLQTTVHVSSRKDIDEIQDHITWGAIYKAFTDGSVSASLAGSNWALGYLGRWDSLTYGVAYQSEILKLNGQSLDRLSQFSFEVGLTF